MVENKRLTCGNYYNITTNPCRQQPRTPQPDQGNAQTHVYSARAISYQESMRLVVSIRSLQLSTDVLGRHIALP